MSIILDLVLAAIVLLCGWRGFRTGIINGICGIVAVIIAIYGANLVATAYSDEFTGMLKPFAIGIVDGALADATGMDEEELDELENSPAVTVSVIYEELDVYTVSMDILLSLGISSSAAEGMAQETALLNDRVGTAMTDDLTNILCERICFVAVFTIAFILIAIVFSVIGNIFDLSFGLPGHENLNHITGAALGVIKGIMLIIAITCICRYLGLLIPEETISKTWILEPLTESNKLASILGI
ncbi:MAG: CvpA family protein [Oscillospiraceae bacterium]